MVRPLRLTSTTDAPAPEPLAVPTLMPPTPPPTSTATPITAPTAAAEAVPTPEAPVASGARVVSAARVAANRANAARSTGPRTAEGKARSRANAVKHGLAGAGICLPGEDAALVQERCLQLHEEMAPQTVRGMMLVETIARAHMRMQRAARQEVASLAYRQRHAVAAFDEERLAQAEADLDYLGQNSTTRYRHLVASPEGIDLLIARLGDVRREVRNPSIRWNYIHGSCLERFCGRRYGDDFNRSRGRALSLALEFDPSELNDDDLEAIQSDYQGRIKDWAVPAMEAHIDAEIARLAAARAVLDHETHARDRAEAAERALFDPGRDAALARRYEAAATRTFFRALQEYPTAEAEAEAQAEAVAVAKIEAQGKGEGEPKPGAGAGPPATGTAVTRAGRGRPSALDPPAAATAEVLAAGEALMVVDPADRAAAPPTPRRSFERPPLGSSGITAQQASDELSYLHYSQPPIPVHLPIPPLVAVLPPRLPG